MRDVLVLALVIGWVAAGLMGIGLMVLAYFWRRNVRRVRQERDAARAMTAQLRRRLVGIAKSEPTLSTRLDLALWTADMPAEVCLIAEQIKSNTICAPVEEGR